jgi:hypothetical protein
MPPSGASPPCGLLPPFETSAPPLAPTPPWLDGTGSSMPSSELHAVSVTPPANIQLLTSRS